MIRCYLHQLLHVCRQNVVNTVNMSTNAVFVVHPVKSVLEPTQEIVYLGFRLNSEKMTVCLTMCQGAKTPNMHEKKCWAGKLSNT